MRREIRGLALRPGDEIRIEGFPDRGAHAAFDYMELHPASGYVQATAGNPGSRGHR